MANPIIQNYLSDTTQPLEKRKRLMSDLQKGASESEAVSAITMKYGNQYGSPELMQQQSTAATEQGTSNIARGLVEGVQTVTNPLKLGQAAGQAIGDNFKEFTQYSAATPEMSPEGKQQLDTKRQMAAQAEAEFEKIGWTPPSQLRGNPDAMIQAFQEYKQQQAYGRPMNEFFTGMAKQAGETLMGAGKLGAETMGAGLSAITGREFTGISEPVVQEWEQSLQADNPIQEGGKVAQSVLEFMAPGMAVSQAVKTLPALANAPKWWQIGAEALGQAGAAFGVQSAQEGEVNPSSFTAAGIAGAIPVIGGIAGSAINKVKSIFSKVPKGFEREALRLGLPEKYVNALNQMDDVSRAKAVKYLEVGVNKMNHMDDAKIPNVFNHAGQQIDDFIAQADDLSNTIGKHVGTGKEGLKQVTVADDILRDGAKQMDDILAQWNIRKIKGGLDYADSELFKSAKAKSLIDKIYKALTKGKNINARNLEAITGQIDQTTGLLGASGLKKTDPAVMALVDAKKILNQIIGQSDDAFGTVNTQFAKLTNTLDDVKDAAKVKIGRGKYAYNGDQILRRYLGSADEKYRNAMDAIEEMGRMVDDLPDNVPSDVLEKWKSLPKLSAQELQNNAFLADLAEKYTMTAPLQGISGGGASTAGNFIPGKAGAAIQALKEAKQYVAPSKPIEEGAKKLMDLLIKAPKLKDGTIKLAPKTVGDVKELLGMILKSGTVKTAGDITE